MSEELRNSQIQIVALTEAKKTDKGKMTLDNGEILMYSGIESTVKPRAAVAILTNKEFIRSVKK